MLINSKDFKFSVLILYGMNEMYHTFHNLKSKYPYVFTTDSFHGVSDPVMQSCMMFEHMSAAH